jgi:RNA polymerase sigma factor (sigma-70 family)
MATQHLNRLAGLLTATYSAGRLADETDADLLDRCRAGADPAAFEAIVRRHGGRVLAACRKVLPDPADVDDAFQATFLTLLRNPRAVRKAESLGAWLYGVAHRTSVRARDTARRRNGLLRIAAKPIDAGAPDLSWKEACAVLHQELEKLPDTLRLPLMLCYLDGQSRDEAAAQLGWSLNEVRGRLERGRSRLRARLQKRGIALSAGLLAAAARTSVTAGVPPTRFIEIALRALAGRPSAAADALASGVSPAMIKTAKAFSAFVVAAGVLVGVVALGTGFGLPGTTVAKQAQPPGFPGPGEKDPPKAPAKPVARNATVTGRVFGPDGKPLAGAKLDMGRPEGSLELGASDADGKFKVKVPVPAGHFSVFLIARADGVGMDLQFISVDRLGDGVELRTVTDNPIRAKIVDTQGKPVAGATVAVSKLIVFRNNSLDEFLDGYKRGDHSPLYPGDATGLWCDTGVLPAVTTDKDGKFEITGVGAERLAALRVSGPGLAVSELWVVNRKEFDPKPYNESKPEPARPDDRRLPLRPAGSFPLHAPDRSLVGEAEKRIRGTVTDVDTGKSCARVKVTLVPDTQESPPIRLSAVTDAEGKYEIRGAHKARTYLLSVLADPNTRHVAAQLRADDTAGFEPATANIKVKKGVVITGKVIDTETKKPVRGYATVSVTNANPFVKDYPGFVLTERMTVSTGEDGTFRIVTIPGPVLLVGGAYRDREKYKPAVADQMLPGSAQVNFSKALEIKADAETVTQDILLEPVK